MLKNILQYLEQTVLRVPNKIAFSDGENSLSFSQLFHASKGIGTYLIDNSCSCSPIMVIMEKHPHEIAAFLGVIYAGGFYIPIDAEMPSKRIEVIAQSTKPALIICDEKNEKLARSICCADVVLYNDISEYAYCDEKLGFIRSNQIDTDPIYIVFTSGSTGIPKGVVACHRSVIDYTESLCMALDFSVETVFGNQTPLYFDAPLKEIMPTLKYGATTYFVPKKLFMFPIKLVEYLNQNKINTICWVVSALTMISAFGAFDKVKPEYLKLIAFGSEVFPIKQFKIWREALPEAVFYNLYGPTEATGMSCYYKVNRDFADNESIPIGKPFNNTRILLIGDDGKSVPQGQPGEICISGTCVTMGYYSNEEKTNEAFIQNPLQHNYREIIYRTGDLAKYNEYGELVFISRKDYQIKHMGHRIELGEIEAAADSVSGVARSCCIYDDIKRKIHLFYIGESVETEVSSFLKGYLPRYMIPSTIVRLETLPLTPNGKLNRRALKEMI